MTKRKKIVSNFHIFVLMYAGPISAEASIGGRYKLPKMLRLQRFWDQLVLCEQKQYFASVQPRYGQWISGWVEKYESGISKRPKGKFHAMAPCNSRHVKV